MTTEHVVFVVVLACLIIAGLIMVSPRKDKWR